MAIEKETKDYFHSGRGNVSEMVAKSGSGVMSKGAVEVGGTDPSGSGLLADDAGAKPVFADGNSPFHKGAGAGRGAKS